MLVRTIDHYNISLWRFNTRLNKLLKKNGQKQVQGKTDQENEPKAVKDKTEIVTVLDRKTKEEIIIYIEKWDQTFSPEIPDREETSEIPRPHFGVKTPGNGDAISSHSKSK